MRGSRLLLLRKRPNYSHMMRRGGAASAGAEVSPRLSMLLSLSLTRDYFAGKMQVQRRELRAGQGLWHLDPSICNRIAWGRAGAAGGGDMTRGRSMPDMTVKL